MSRSLPPSRAGNGTGVAHGDSSAAPRALCKLPSLLGPTGPLYLTPSDTYLAPKGPCCPRAQRLRCSHETFL